MKIEEENIKYGLFGVAMLFLLGITFSINYRIDTLENNHIAHLENITEGAEWVCIAQVCIAYDYGDDWIVANCRPKGEDKTLMCNITGTDSKLYNAPLSIINMSNVKSCREYACATEVYVRGRKEINKKEVSK